MVARSALNASAEVALISAEVVVFDRAVPSAPGVALARTLASYLLKGAWLDGYLAHIGNPPPGNAVMWRGWARLADTMFGVELAE